MKRKVKKSNEKSFNKQTSTDDKMIDNKTSYKLFQKKYSNNNIRRTTSNQQQQTSSKTLNNFMKNTENKIKRTISEENLLNSIKETDDLRNLLSEKNEEFEKNKKTFLNEILLLNNNIKSKSSELEMLSINSKNLLNKLNQLNSKINEEYQKIKLADFVTKSSKDKLINNEKINENKIKNSKKLILLNNTIIDKFKIHKEKLEKIIEEDKSTKLINLKSELEELNNNEQELKNELEKLRLIKETHEKKCDKSLENLKINLERIKKEYNLEYKVKDENKSPTIKKPNTLNNKNVNSLPNIYNNIINPDNNEEKKTIFQQRIFKKKPMNKEKIIHKDFEEFQEQIKNKIEMNSKQDIKNYINSRNEKRKDFNDSNNLFSSQEQNLLKDFIPMEILNVYQNKFKTLRVENNQIIQILQKNEPKKKLIEEKNQLEFIKDKKDYNIQKRNIELSSKILRASKNIKQINKEISDLEKELDKINIIYNTKKLDNDKFKETWKSFYNDIKNKKIIVKKEEKVSEEELSYIERFGKIAKIKKVNSINSYENADQNESDIIILNAT